MNKESRSVYLIGQWHGYDSQFFSEISIPGYEVIVFNPLSNFSYYSILKYMPGYIRSSILKNKAKDLILKNPDAIFIFREDRYLLRLMAEICCPASSGVIFRNKVSKSTRMHNIINNLKNKSYNLWSFDKDDCSEYNMIYYEQYIDVYPGIADIKATVDFAFIGRNKGREAQLNLLKKRLEKAGYTVSISILGTKENNVISYFEYLKGICSAKCIIDIVKQGQIGTTLRPLEGALYKRKVITNNKSVSKLDIYNKDNILILNDDLSIDGVDLFMKKKQVFVDKIKLECHDPKFVLNKIISKLDFKRAE